jgi:lysozyme
MTILGLDISKWNGNWDATKAKQAGASFVFIKASQATYTDPKFAANWQKAKEAGLLRGAYHYLDYTKPGADQANYLADLLKNDPGELPPVIDYEQRRTDNNPSAALSFLRDCLDQLARRTELFADAHIKQPIIYAGPDFWAEYGDQTKRDYWIKFPLWLAHWTTSSTPLVPPPWPLWHFWQFTAKGPGEAFGTESLSVDMDRFNGTLNELLEFSGVRIPVVNLSELFATLTEKVDNLSDVVANLGQSGGSPDSAIFDRVDHLEDQFTSLGDSFTSLTQRIAVLEGRNTWPGNNSNQTPAPASEPLRPPETVPNYPPKPEEDAQSQVTPPVAETSKDLYATCITSALNVRSGPGASYPMVAGLKYGQRVKVIKRQNGWAQFEDPAGWSSEAYLTFDQNASPTPAADPLPEGQKITYGICNTSGLNVRSGPGATFAIVGGLTYGQRVKILAHKDGWAQIETPSGWCNESYLSFA